MAEHSYYMFDAHSAFMFLLPVVVYAGTLIVAIVLSGKKQQPRIFRAFMIFVAGSLVFITAIFLGPLFSIGAITGYVGRSNPKLYALFFNALYCAALLGSYFINLIGLEQISERSRSKAAVTLLFLMYAAVIVYQLMALYDRNFFHNLLKI